VRDETSNAVAARLAGLVCVVAASSGVAARAAGASVLSWSAPVRIDNRPPFQNANNLVSCVLSSCGIYGVLGYAKNWT